MQIRKIREYDGHRGALYTLCSTGDPQRFLAAGAEGIVSEWDSGTGEGISRVNCGGPVFSLVYFPERGLLLAGMQSGLLIWADLHAGKVLKTVQLHKKAIFDFAPFPDGRHVLASSQDGTLSVWDLDKQENVHHQFLSRHSIRSLAMHPTAGRIAVGSSDHHIRILDLNLRTLAEWEAHTLPVFRVLWGSTPDALFSVGRDAQLRLWNSAAAPQEINAVPAHLYSINDLIHAPGLPLLLTASMDKSIKLWEAGPSLHLHKVVNYEKSGCHRFGVNRLLPGPGHRFWSCGDDRLIMEWEIVPGQD